MAKQSPKIRRMNAAQVRNYAAHLERKVVGLQLRLLAANDAQAEKAALVRLVVKETAGVHTAAILRAMELWVTHPNNPDNLRPQLAEKMASNQETPK